LAAGPAVTFPSDGAASPAGKAATVQSTPVGPGGTNAPLSAPGKVTPSSAKIEAKPAKPVVKVKVTEYWIQVASFKDRYQAENTAKALENQGLKGTLSTANVNGKAVVRVRVGPYTNQAEADKFLAWLKPVKEFDGSYITKASAIRAQ
jgi:cell division protein FtsN